MNQKKINKIFYCDSDALTFDSMANLYRIYNLDKYSCGLLVPKPSHELQWTANGAFSYWTKESLEDFCKFCTKSFQSNIYKKKIDFHKKEKIPGGICDMTSLFLWSKTKTRKICNLAKTIDGNIIDDNINSPDNFNKDEFLFNQLTKTKDIVFKNNNPFLRSSSEKIFKAAVLHFQGPAKCLIPYYTEGHSKITQPPSVHLRAAKKIITPLIKKYVLFQSDVT